MHLHSGNLFGGIERAIITCVRNLQFAPHLRFEFAVCFSGTFRGELSALKQPIHVLPEVRVRNPLSLIRARRQLARILRMRTYDAVVCHSTWTHSIFAPVIQGLGMPELFWAHDHYDGRHWLERWASRTAPNLVISNGEFSNESVEKLFPGVARQIVRNPVEIQRRHWSAAERRQIRAEFGTADNTVAIVQVSRMEAWKGHDLLLEAATRLRTSAPWKIWFIGGAQRPQELSYLETLKTKAKHLGIADRVTFGGQHSDVPRVLAAADIFCQPNRAAEPFGIVFIEALSQGLPVVTFNMGGPAEIVDPTCGVLVEPGNLKTLAAELDWLISDSALRRSLGEAGPARARQLCDPAVVLPQLQQVITSLVGNSP
ncbi:MAG TPA: glycosyltransferase family 4 protein [Terriglobales bacterium]|nr:glycosyltransferase family 4 protein [Terriglobales bacterium]